MMQPAKSCWSCYHCGSLTYGPECRSASTVECCEDWKAPFTVRGTVTLDIEVDLQGYSLDYDEQFKTLEELAKFLNMKSSEEFIMRMLESKTDSITIADVRDVEIESGVGNVYRETVKAHQGMVIVA